MHQIKQQFPILDYKCFIFLKNLKQETIDQYNSRLQRVVKYINENNTEGLQRLNWNHWYLRMEELIECDGGRLRY